MFFTYTCVVDWKGVMQHRSHWPVDGSNSVSTDSIFIDFQWRKSTSQLFFIVFYTSWLLQVFSMVAFSSQPFFPGDRSAFGKLQWDVLQTNGFGLFPLHVGGHGHAVDQKQLRTPWRFSPGSLDNQKWCLFILVIVHVWFQNSRLVMIIIFDNVCNLLDGMIFCGSKLIL